MNNSKVCAFIPARIGSKSIPQKNIKLLGDKPLIAWSIQSAQKAGIDQIVVDTDSVEICRIATDYGAEVLERPKSLSKDSTGMYEVLRADIPRIASKPDIIVLLQPTSPFRSKNLVQIAISYLDNNPDFDSVISCERVPEKFSPYAMILQNSGQKVMLFRKLISLKEKLISLFIGKKFVGPTLSGYPISQRMTRRQDLPPCWLPDGAIYVFRASNLKQGSIYGRNTLILENEGNINLNNLEDFKNAEEKLNQFKPTPQKIYG